MTRRYSTAVKACKEVRDVVLLDGELDGGAVDRNEAAFIRA
jgi:hypothetical protein